MATYNSFYLDYNSTSPLHQSVINAFSNGDILFANVSSQHNLGKKSSAFISQINNFLFNYFQVSQKEYKIFYHSGVTEAVNTFFNGSKYAICSVTDHPCVKNVVESVEDQLYLNVKADGHLDLQNINKRSNEFKSQSVHINLTLVHNETGVVLNLSDLKKIKEIFPHSFIHLDAAQFVGKSPYTIFTNGFDMVSFSGHKFGALKGIGFSFVKKDFKLNPFIIGGGQQFGLRSGTINSDGIQSIYFALKDRNLVKEYEEVLKFKQEIEVILQQNKNIILIANKSSNTICFMHKEKKSDEILIHFDMNGLYVSAGSACSAGSFQKSETLIAMGFEATADHNIRISLGHESLKDQEQIKESIFRVLAKL